MLENIGRLGKEGVLVVYSQVPALTYVVQDLIYAKYDINRAYSVSCSNLTSAKRALADAEALPLLGTKWCIRITADCISISDIYKILSHSRGNAILLFECSNYSLYTSIIKSDTYKGLEKSNIANSIYLGRLTSASVDILYRYYTGDSDYKYLSKKLIEYIKKNYMYNPDLVCELFSRVGSGSVVQSEGDIVSLVGLGGNTPQALVFTMLTTSTATASGKSRLVKKCITLLNDLSLKYSYSSIYSFMMDSLDGAIDMKTLYICGKYRDWYRDIPECYSQKQINRLNRLKRFERVILNDIPLKRMLILAQAFRGNKTYDAKFNIIRGIYQYISLL